MRTDSSDDSSFVEQNPLKPNSPPSVNDQPHVGRVHRRRSVLLIDNESSVAEIILNSLKQEGFQTHWESDGIRGLVKAQSLLPDLCILDVTLPGLDGLQICRSLKSDPRTRIIRILILTACSSEADEIVGFCMGADDFVTKPFRVQPLMHRITALLREFSCSDSGTQVRSLHGIEIDEKNRRVVVDESPLILTPTEFVILWTLMSQPGRTFYRSELLKTPDDATARTHERSIDVHVLAIRRKLSARGLLIETIRGIGYRFRREPPESEILNTFICRPSTTD